MMKVLKANKLFEDLPSSQGGKKSQNAALPTEDGACQRMPALQILPAEGASHGSCITAGLAPTPPPLGPLVSMRTGIRPICPDMSSTPPGYGPLKDREEREPQHEPQGAPGLKRRAWERGRHEEGGMARQGPTAREAGRSDEGDPWAPGPMLALSGCQWHAPVSRGRLWAGKGSCSSLRSQRRCQGQTGHSNRLL